MDFAELLNDAHNQESDGKINKALEIYKKILASEGLRDNYGEGYFEFAAFLFRNGYYDDALQMFVHAYDLQYKPKEILDIIDEAYYTPNLKDLRLLYAKNMQVFKEFYPETKTLEFGELTIKLIPASDDKFYLFDCKNDKFIGTFLKNTTIDKVDVKTNQVILIRDIYHMNIIDSYEKVTRDNHKETKWDLPLYLIYDDINMYFALLQINDFSQIIRNPRIKMLFNEIQVQEYFNKAESYIPELFINVKPNDHYVDYIRELYKKRMNRFNTQIINEKLVDVHNGIVTIKKSKNEKLRIIIFEGQSQYDVLRYFGKFLRDAFIQQGHEAILFDMMIWNQEDYARLVKRFKPDFTVGFNPITYYYSGKTHFEFFNIPHLVILVDSPYYHVYHRALVNPNSPLVGMVATEFSNIFNKMNTERVYTPKTWGVPESIATVNPYNSYRPIPNLFIGGLEDTQKYLDIPANNIIMKILKDFLHDIPCILEKEKKYFNRDISEIFIDYCSSNGSKVLDETLDIFIFKNIEGFYRNFCREKAIRDLLESGNELYLFGNELLKQKFSKYNNAHIYPTVGYTECMELIGQSKFVLNVSPMFFKFHDRITTALMSGSCLISTPLPGLFADYPEIRDVILSYDYDDINKITGRINQLLENEDERLSIAKKGQLLAREYFTMEKYAGEILDAYQKLF